MNKTVIFGGSEAFFADNQIKNKVIDYLYSKLDLSKHRYILLTQIQKLKFLADNEHYVSPNFKGFNYFLIMLKINEKKYCIAIDRKQLSYHKDQVDIKMVKMFILKMNTTDILYEGTIFDGKLIQSKNGYLFLIQDCFYLMGNKMLEKEMNEKNNNLDTILKNHFKKESGYCQNFEFRLNKLYKYDMIEELINKIIPEIQIETTGLIFYPKFSGVTIIHRENKDIKTNKINITTKNTEVIENKTYHIINDFVNFLKAREYSYDTDPKIKQYWLSKTLIPDVYDVCENNTNTNKLGIALIPNLKISQMCDDIITDKPVKFNCMYSKKFKKWMPISVNSS